MMNYGFLDFAVNIPKFEHFEGVGFRRWQKKMKFLLAALNVAYVLSTPKLVEQENETLEATRSHLYVEEGIRQKESKNKGGARVTGASGSTINFVDEGKPYGNRKGKGKPGKATKSSKFKKNGKGKGKAPVKCWVCNGPHFKKDCEVWKKRKAQMEGKSSDDHGQVSGQWKQEGTFKGQIEAATDVTHEELGISEQTTSLGNEETKEGEIETGNETVPKLEETENDTTLSAFFEASNAA
nr:uncharacterized protein LOC109192662 [Ipomoea batatas]